MSLKGNKLVFLAVKLQSTCIETTLIYQYKSPKNILHLLVPDCEHFLWHPSFLSHSATPPRHTFVKTQVQIIIKSSQAFTVLQTKAQS